MNRLYRKKARSRERARLIAREKLLSQEAETLGRIVRDPDTSLKDLNGARARLLDVISKRDAIHNRLSSINKLD